MVRIVAREGGVGSGSGRGMEARPVKKGNQLGGCSPDCFMIVKLYSNADGCPQSREGNAPGTPDQLVALVHARLKAGRRSAISSSRPNSDMRCYRKSCATAPGNTCSRAASHRSTAWSGSRTCWMPPIHAMPAPAQNLPRAATAMAGRGSEPLSWKRYTPRRGGTCAS